MVMGQLSQSLKQVAQEFAYLTWFLLPDCEAALQPSLSWQSLLLVHNYCATASSCTRIKVTQSY